MDWKTDSPDPGSTGIISLHVVHYIDSQGKHISLAGKLYRPAEPGKYPAVILCHGFNGHHTDFPLECTTFTGFGYVCLAFDFCGAQADGLSIGRTSSEYTPYTMVEDLKAVIADLRSRDFVGDQIFLFGGSQGGLVAGLTAADPEIQDQVAGLAMYYPALCIPENWHGAPEQETALMGYSIGPDYIRSVQDMDPYAILPNYPGDVCIVSGDKDMLVTMNYIQRAVDAYGKDRVDLTVISGAGHGFVGEDAKTATKAVLDFLLAHRA